MTVEAMDVADGDGWTGKPFCFSSERGGLRLPGEQPVRVWSAVNVELQGPVRGRCRSGEGGAVLGRWPGRHGRGQWGEEGDFAGGGISVFSRIIAAVSRFGAADAIVFFVEALRRGLVWGKGAGIGRAGGDERTRSAGDALDRGPEEIYKAVGTTWWAR